ncbi:hypothetical protein [Citreicella sp. C3M06]|uniref:hypothetical protein n=1 Tax=Citreicella sp. C3M06 TaxID=2841564 RepID=UPI002090CE67|nr:hypothetical protein [Citreicella sp. C3M06]
MPAPLERLAFRTVRRADQITGLLTAFVAGVIGGFGSLPGAVLGGFLGAVEVVVLVLLPQSYGGLVFALVALILVWRPDGILSPAKERRQL